VKPETTIEILLSDFNDFEIRTSSENSSSEHSVDNDVVAANVNYTKNGTSVPRIWKEGWFYFRWID
jgi:hypothetical protein